MLTKSVLDSIQRAAGLATFTAAVPNVELTAELTTNKAANAQSFDQHAALARRSRRMRRAERGAFRSTGGWTVRLW